MRFVDRVLIRPLVPVSSCDALVVTPFVIVLLPYAPLVQDEKDEKVKVKES